MSSRINAEWHRAHEMPPKATTEQRIAWHLQHAEHCGCRPIPATLLKEMKKRRLQK